MCGMRERVQDPRLHLTGHRKVVNTNPRQPPKRQIIMQLVSEELAHRSLDRLRAPDGQVLPSIIRRRTRHGK